MPFTRGPSGPALQFEIELTSLDELDQFRSRGLGSSEETAQLLHSFSEILLSPPCVEILRAKEIAASSCSRCPHRRDLFRKGSFTADGAQGIVLSDKAGFLFDRA